METVFQPIVLLRASAVKHLKNYLLLRETMLIPEPVATVQGKNFQHVCTKLGVEVWEKADDQRIVFECLGIPYSLIEIGEFYCKQDLIKDASRANQRL